MNTLAKVLLGFLVIFAVFGVFTIGSVIGLNNTCVNQEAGIVAQYKQNQNNYDNFVKTIQEIAQVPAMYTEDLKKVYVAVVSGRYGSKGSQAMFQFIKEHNPTFDSTLYTKIQRTIEAGRNSFEADQKTLLDKKRVYEVTLHTFPNSLVASSLGFPKINLDKYDIVTSTETENTFATKKSTPLKLR